MSDIRLKNKWKKKTISQTLIARFGELMIGDYMQLNPPSVSILWAAILMRGLMWMARVFLPTNSLLHGWGFCNINPNEMKEMMIDGLTKLANKMDVLPNDVEPEFGPIFRPMVISRNAKRSIEAVRHSRKTLGKVAKSTLKCSSVVVPLQDKAPVRFIVMNFQIGRRPYEMEAVFCNERMLMVGENSGIWTRLEWINEFNIPMFNIGTALHPYWRPE